MAWCDEALLARTAGVEVLSSLDLEAIPFRYIREHFGYRDRLMTPEIEGSGIDPTPGSGRSDRQAGRAWHATRHVGVFATLLRSGRRHLRARPSGRDPQGRLKRSGPCGGGNGRFPGVGTSPRLLFPCPAEERDSKIVDTYFSRKKGPKATKRILSTRGTSGLLLQICIC